MVFNINENVKNFLLLSLRLYSNLMIDLAHLCLNKEEYGIINRNGNDNHNIDDIGLKHLEKYILLNDEIDNNESKKIKRIRNLKLLCKTDFITSNIGLNDIYVMGLALHINRNLKHGWFANEKQHSCRYRSDMHERRIPGGLCNPCPVSTENGFNNYHLPSSFQLPKIFSHVKGGRGPMSRQHSKHNEAKKTFTPDESMELPKEYFPISKNNHIDHRLGCYDKRGKYLKKWSLKQDILIY